VIVFARAGPCLLLSACAVQIPEVGVQRDSVIVRCTVIGRGAAAGGIVVGGGLVRRERAMFNFRSMSFRIGRLQGRILSTAFMAEGRRSAALSGGGVVTFPQSGGIGHIVFNEGARVDEIICGRPSRQSL
jgi:hypothetical protein